MTWWHKLVSKFKKSWENFFQIVLPSQNIWTLLCIANFCQHCKNDLTRNLFKRFISTTIGNKEPREQFLWFNTPKIEKKQGKYVSKKLLLKVASLFLTIAIVVEAHLLIYLHHTGLSQVRNRKRLRKSFQSEIAVQKVNSFWNKYLFVVFTSSKNRT